MKPKLSPHEINEARDWLYENINFDDYIDLEIEEGLWEQAIWDQRNGHS